MLGPPMIGAIAQVSNLAVALGVAGLIAMMIAPAALTASWARRRESGSDQAPLESVPSSRSAVRARH
jgi:hypothetical protein